MNTCSLLVVLAAAIVSFGQVHAGDVAAGREKSLLCVSCHGAHGVSEHLNWPNFAGQNVGYIAKQLRDFRAGARHDPWMSPMAVGLTDGDIDNLSAYFSSLPGPTPADDARPTGPKEQTCVACHGTNGVIDHDVWPNLAGQKKLYLIAQMNRYRSGERVDPLMSPIAKTLTDNDIEALAEYYSAL